MPPPIKVSTDQVLAALEERPGATAAELAQDLGLGQSTAAKRLAALEADGAARREPGEGRGPRRLPDRWYRAAAATTVEAIPDEVRPDEVGPDEVRPDVPEAVPGEVREPDAGPEDASRLGRGALGAMVRDYLAAHPGDDLGPTQIAKALGGKSGGAVGNALARLEASGEARLVSASPRRYRITAQR